MSSVAFDIFQGGKELKGRGSIGNDVDEMIRLPWTQSFTTFQVVPCLEGSDPWLIGIRTNRKEPEDAFPSLADIHIIAREPKLTAEFGDCERYKLRKRAATPSTDSSRYGAYTRISQGASTCDRPGYWQECEEYWQECEKPHQRRYLTT